MKRTLLGLIAVLLATAMLSGCFWHDRRDDDRGRDHEHGEMHDRGDRGDYDQDRH